MMATTNNDIQRDLGRMEGRLDAMEDRLSKIETIAERIDQRLARIEEAESKRLGAFSLGKLLYAAAIGLVGWLSAHFWK